MLRTHRDTLVSILETLVHDPLVEWVPKNAKSGAEEGENAMARDAMATIEGDRLKALDLITLVSTYGSNFHCSHMLPVLSTG